MNVVWLCNIVMPKACEILKIKQSALGGWMTGLYKSVSEKNRLYIISPCAEVREIVSFCDNNVTFYVIPKRGSVENQNNFENILKNIDFDVVHIWGTEYNHTLDMMKVCKKLGVLDKTVISIQGLCSVCAKHYCSGLPYKILHRYTIRDIMKKSNINKAKKRFEKNGDLEVEALKMSKHVIGRTDWDRACTEQINPDVNYHFCNETLRPTFYANRWNFEDCEKHSIFLSQGNNPIKGLHFMIEALLILKKTYPDVKLYVGGLNLVNRGWKISYYGKYIRNLISKYDLQENIIFTDTLNEEQMCQRYLKSNVSVLSSVIENSPNSVGEAMLLGMPVVASDVGGVKNLLQHEAEGYIYPHDEPYMLAYYIKKIFEDSDSAKTMGEKARQKALKIHDREKNLLRLMEIYNCIK